MPRVEQGRAACKSSILSTPNVALTLTLALALAYVPIFPGNDARSGLQLLQCQEWAPALALPGVGSSSCNARSGLQQLQCQEWLQLLQCAAIRVDDSHSCTLAMGRCTPIATLPLSMAITLIDLQVYPDTEL